MRLRFLTLAHGRILAQVRNTRQGKKVKVKAPLSVAGPSRGKGTEQPELHISHRTHCRLENVEEEKVENFITTAYRSSADQTKHNSEAADSEPICHSK